MVTLGFSVDLASKKASFNLDESTIDAIETHKTPACGLVPISRCPTNSGRTCWGTTLGACWSNFGSKPSDAIGQWTITMHVVRNNGVMSNIYTSHWNVTTTLVEEN